MNALNRWSMSFFDRFIEVGDDLLCIDVKRWATQLDDLTRAEETLEKSDNKIRQIRNIASQKADTEGRNSSRRRWQAVMNVFDLSI